MTLLQRDPRKVKESAIERAIGEYLHYSGYCFFKNSPRGYFKGKIGRDQSGCQVMVGRFRKDLNPFALPGLPDYTVIYRGMYLGLEIKTESGRQSTVQKEFEGYVTIKGQARYSIVRSVEDAERIVKAFKAEVDLLYLTSNQI